MASHQLLYFFVLLFLFIYPCHSSTQKVNLSLYFESLCPSCLDFIAHELVNVFETDLINIVNLSLVPWGNAQMVSDNKDNCQYGPDECYLNSIHGCAITVWPDVKKHFSFIHCVANQTLKTQKIKDAKAAWVKCSKRLGFDQKIIEDCWKNGFLEKWKVDRHFANETKALNPPHEYVPWVTVNNQPLYYDYENFAAHVCKAYKGISPPMACRSLPTRKFISNHSVCYADEAMPPNLPKASWAHQGVKIEP